MSKILCAVAVLGCCLVACDGEEPSDGGATKTLTLRTEGAERDLSYCSDDGECQSLPNPNDCSTLVISIDTATGQTCERCENDQGVGIERCGSTSVVCEIVTLPEPDCVVCAYINGAVVFTTCNPPAETCADIACPAIYPVCPGGAEPRPDPNDCCGYICPPTSCDAVMCAAFAGCPEGTDRVIEPPNCCGTCVPQVCASSSECPTNYHCSVEDGVCDGCNAPAGIACTAVCRGSCTPDLIAD